MKRDINYARSFRRPFDSAEGARLGRASAHARRVGKLANLNWKKLPEPLGAKDVCFVLGCRRKAYLRLVKSGELKSVADESLGYKRFLVSQPDLKDLLRRWLNQQMEPYHSPSPEPASSKAQPLL